MLVRAAAVTFALGALMVAYSMPLWGFKRGIAGHEAGMNTAYGLYAAVALIDTVVLWHYGGRLNELARNPSIANVGKMLRAMRYVIIAWIVVYLMTVGFSAYLKHFGIVLPAVAIAVGLDTFTQKEQREAANLRLVLQLALAVPVLMSLIAIGEMIARPHSVVKPTSRNSDLGRIIGIAFNIVLIGLLWRLSHRMQQLADAPSLTTLARAAAGYRTLHLVAAVAFALGCLCLVLLLAAAVLMPADVLHRVLQGG